MTLIHNLPTAPTELSTKLSTPVDDSPDPGDFLLRGLPVLVLLSLLLVLLPGTGAAALRVRDDAGRTVTLPRPASRIVSLYVAHTENLVALGAKGQLAGVSAADDPAWAGPARRLPLKPDVEALLALRPDLVVLRPLQLQMQPQLLGQLERFHIPVAVLEPPAWGNLASYLNRLGALTGRTAEARRVAERTVALTDRARRRHQSEPRPGVFLVTTARTLTTCAPGSWADRLLEAAGGENLASDARPLSPGSAVASFGDERLLGLGNRLRLVLVQQGAMNALPASELARDPRLSALEAVRAGRVRDVPEAFVSRPSVLRLPKALALLESLVDGAREGGKAKP